MTAICYVIFYLICALNVIWGIKKAKSNALYAIAMVAIFILMTFNYDGPDIGVYIAAYKTVGDSPNLLTALDATYMERGYSFLMFCASKIGLDFYSFRIIITIICLALFASIIRYYKVNPNFIVGLYMAYLFFFDTIQLRNCIIQFIILFATRYLFKKSAASLIKYVICIVIAASIHTLSWLFLSLLLIRFVKSQKRYKNIFALAAAMFALCVILQPVLPRIIELLVKILKRGSGYLTGTISYGYWVVMLLYILGLAPLYMYRNKIDNDDVKNKINLIMKIEIIMGLFLPLCFINNNFNRIFRNVLILDTIGLALLYENLKKGTEANDVTLSAQILLVGGWLCSDLMRYEARKIIGSVMEYNLVYMHLSMSNLWQYALVSVICLATVFVIRKLFSYHGKQHRREMECA